jgi:hypothetical protein
VLYFDALGQSTLELRTEKAGPEHSGLSEVELEDHQIIHDHFKIVLKSATLAAERSALHTA